MKSFITTDAPGLVRQSRARHPSRKTFNFAAQTIAERASALVRAAMRIAASTDTSLDAQYEDAAMLIGLIEGTSEPAVILRSYRQPVPDDLSDQLAEEMRDRAAHDVWDVQDALACSDLKSARRAVYRLLHAIESWAGLKPNEEGQS